MKTILILGAGRSSSCLIRYLLDQATSKNWIILVADASLQLAQAKIKNHPSGKAIEFDIHKEENAAIISFVDVVISLLPPSLHAVVARYCLKHKKHLLTASYVSDEMKEFHNEASALGLTFINECGLDPGIDHMSAMKVIDGIKHKGGKLTSFESFTGGLIAPETDPENPWRYKFTWNPKNVVTAGQGTAKYLQNGKFKYIPYQRLFTRTTPVHIPGAGEFEGYANRDSLKYIDTYNLYGIKTMLRGTLRAKGFCSAWNVFVQLGCCDDSYNMESVDTLTHASFLNSFSDDHKSLEENLKSKNIAASREIELLKWSGLFDETPVGLSGGTPAQILEHILHKKWKLNDNDKDWVVMWHCLGYELNGKQNTIQAVLTAKGNDPVDTAMAQTVGLPLGIACKLLLEKKIKSKGVVIPVIAELYEPVLAELKTLGIELSEFQS